LTHTSRIAALPPSERDGDCASRSGGSRSSRTHAATAALSLRPHFAHKRVVIIGGGITSAHLTLVALRARAASVVLLSRKKLVSRAYDLDAAWMSRARTALLTRYWAMEPEARAAAIRENRGGGTVPPELLGTLRFAVAASDGRARLFEGAEVLRATPSLACAVQCSIWAAASFAGGARVG